MAALILELYLPTSGAISRDCASLSEALSAAGAYYAGFPAGWAEIRERGSGRVVLAQADLHAACTAGRWPDGSGAGCHPPVRAAAALMLAIDHNKLARAPNGVRDLFQGSAG